MMSWQMPSRRSEYSFISFWLRTRRFRFGLSRFMSSSWIIWFAHRIRSSESLRLQSRLVEDYVYELTGDSLQSSEQLFKTCAALGADGQAAIGDAKTLKNVFDARNQIIHEL